jgi:hypothetical protein
MRLFVLMALGVTPFLAVAPAAAASASPAQRYVTCVAQKHPQTVRALLQASDRVAADRPYRSLAEDDRCFSVVFRDEAYNPQDVVFPIDVLRGKLAEQALLGKVAEAKALPALPLQQKRYIRPWFAATGRDASVDEMGACIADTDPANVIFLVSTTPGSAEENRAVANLTPSLGKCLSAGTRLQAGRPSLRAALAEALYQRMINPALSAPAQETPK